MRVTKFGHSCVRLSYDGRDVVIDPGGWSQREALDHVAAVLITHEHDVASRAQRVVQIHDGLVRASEPAEAAS